MAKTIQQKAEALLASRTTKRGRPKKWENYSPKEKIVAIAYDVIQSVLAGVYFPTQSRYIGDQVLRNAALEEGVNDVQTLLVRGAVQRCNVCQIGSAFLSLVRFENNLEVSTVDDFINNSVDHRGGTGRARLAELFGDKQLALLETAYMKIEYGSQRKYLAELQVTKAKSFGLGYAQDDDRMLAIWMNVIKNKGKFKP